ncbi:MAG TPA: hypothetical protein VF677_02725 [Flavobacterium sp.]|jgi:hypothetical protein
MKEWFKYEFGYVNIDSENLYLTSSGNWSEIKDLKEKTKQVANKNDNKSSSILGFIIVSLSLLVFLIIKNFISGKVGLTLVLIAIGGGYKLYEYMKSEIGAKFKIPLTKITAIKENDKSIEIIFINGEGKTDNYKLHRVENKGIKIVTSLKQYIVQK